MRKTLNCLAIAFILCVMPRACRMEYTSDVIDSMPQPIYEQLLANHPGWGIDRIADYYMDHRDSLEREMRLEEEYMCELKEYLSNNKN